MYKPILAQSIIFLLFFQPKLLASALLRRMLLVLVLILCGLYYLAQDLDPFAWVLYILATLLTYWTANKALRWVFVQRLGTRKEARALAKTQTEMESTIQKKDRQVHVLQAEIERVSDIYENLKEMSSSMNILDIFVNLSEAILHNFPAHKVRLLLLKVGSTKRRMIEGVYQVDRAHLELRSTGRAMMTNDAMFRGETYPSDLELVRRAQNATGSTFWTGADENLVLLSPIRPDKDLAAIIAVEGMDRRHTESIGILSGRFQAEFKRIRLYADVERMATTDWLTGLFVRRYFFKRLEEEISRCKRFHLNFAFLMIDIDDFKIYNDRHGHLVGDALLKKCAQVIRQNVREVDLVGRFGGEEFAAILLDTDQEGAMFVGQRIRKNIEKSHFRVYDEEISLTVSIGLATYVSQIAEGSEIVEWADSALYQAKRQGKNRVCAFVP